MKKFLGIVYSFVIALLAFVPSFLPRVASVSAETQTTLNFNLTCEEANEVSKATGDIITVTYTLENKTETDSSYDISSLANEIYYDHTFFELVDGSSKVTTGLNLTTKLAVYSSGEHRVYFNGFELPTKQYGAKQVIGTFQLKIIATEGSSTVRSVKMLAYGDSAYAITSTDLAVKIGDAPITPIYQLTFETNGGSPISLEKKEAGTVIDLSGYTPVRSGFTFEGWYSDAELTNKVASVSLNGNTTVYAKWTEKIVATYYALRFETNGGGEIPEIEGKEGDVVDLSIYVPVRSGFTFEGWYSDAELTNKISSVKLSGNTKIYAKWIEEKDSDSEGVTPPSSDVEKPDDSSAVEQPSENGGFDWTYALIILAVLVVVILLAYILMGLLA